MCVGRAAAKRAAAVGRAALAAHEPLLLEAIHEPRHAAAREQRGIGELAHAQMLIAALREHEQHLVLGHGESVRLLELGVECCEHARVRAQETPPGGELAARELIPCRRFGHAPTVPWRAAPANAPPGGPR
jgi:hypothetical protein